MDDMVDTLRRFNRSFTQRIGVLDDRFLGLERPLGASRLLWEIGDRPRPISELRTMLGLDSAYLSRLLRTLEAEGLAETINQPSDRRRRAVRLTPRGKNEWKVLEDRSNELAETLVAPLSSSQQHQLASALQTADRLLAAAGVQITSVDPQDPIAVDALRSYFGELEARFEGGFDPGDTIAADADIFRPPTGRFLVGHSDRELVACGAVHRISFDTAEVKRMWVSPEWRGLKLGRRMLHELEHQATVLGCSVVRLDTNSALVEAIAMYTSSGYEPIERYNENPYAKCWFERRLRP